jgi:hypothetical protein
MGGAGQSPYAGPPDPAAANVAFFVALMATALALGGALAHAFELPNKIGLPAAEYFVVQKAYRGWNRLAFVLLVQLIAMIAAAVLSRHRRRAMWATILAILCLVAAQAVFWIWTYPANVATENWTSVPADWRVLRRQWEYSHAAGAAFQLIAMAALAVAVLSRTANSPARPP